MLIAAPAQADQARAQELQRAAMDDDFLNTDFNPALLKLKEALSLCKRRCSKRYTATLYRDAGVIYLTGFNDAERADKAFRKALSLDAGLSLDRAFATPEVKEAFAAAGGKGGALLHDPVFEAEWKNPIPIYVELMNRRPGLNVTLSYRLEDQEDWKRMRMRRRGRGLGATIPCGAVKSLGSIEYYILVKANGRKLANSGDRRNPHIITLVRKSQEDPIAFPGRDPPDSCSGKKRRGVAKRRKKRRRKKRRRDDEYEDDEYEDDEYEDDEYEDDEDRPKKKKKKKRKPQKQKQIWVGLGFQFDLAWLGGNDVCTAKSQTEFGIYCYKEDGSQYGGDPVEGEGDKITPGFVPSTMRILLSGDYIVARPLSLGGRVGFAFNGGPTPGGGSPFFPIHAEVRAGFWPLRDGAFPVDGFGFQMFLGGGMAQVDGSKGVQVKNRSDSAIEPNAVLRLDANKRMGRNFIGPGLGAWYGIKGAGGISFEVKSMILLPDFGFTASPTIGYAFGF